MRLDSPSQAKHNLSLKYPFFGVPVSVHTISELDCDVISFTEGQQLRYCGFGAKFEEVIIKGNPGEMKVNHSALEYHVEWFTYLLTKFIAYYVKNNQIVAVARCGFLSTLVGDALNSVSYYSMQNDPVVSKASELLRLGLMPSPEEVRAGKVKRFLASIPGPEILMELCIGFAFC